MNYYFITGSSKGLGKALVELLLEDEGHVVFGAARSQSVQHPRYHHQQLDLADLDQVTGYRFPELPDAETVVLVNNAGIVGDVKHAGNIDNEQIITCYNTNLIAPAILCNNFIKTYGGSSAKKLIINISSGAGRHPIDGWNVYCSTKAGLDMFSRVVHEESRIDRSDLIILSLAPGIIDTGMQSEIRSADQTDFSGLEKFVAYKANGDLAAPELTAKQVLRFIREPQLAAEVLCSVRDLPDA
ncbi:MAG: SDR family NAD(P)-dependent oxidoreductase [Flavobacteriales bacterium]|nr:SDR family NAD(P)-dependent oxidoreductase [Flavobacteriales bacterium]